MGIVVFAAAIATLALVTLPYATERPVAVDRWSSYAVLAGAGWLAFAYRILELGSVNAFSFGEPVDVDHEYPGPLALGHRAGHPGPRRLRDDRGAAAPLIHGAPHQPSGSRTTKITCRTSPPVVVTSSWYWSTRHASA